MHVLMIFLDGVGLGEANPQTNPFMTAHLPTLHKLSGGQRWTNTTPAYHTSYTSFVPTDANLGLEGRPQSATGQATIISGLNIPQKIGEHYGPKPNVVIRQILDDHNLFLDLHHRGKSLALLEAYPPDWHKQINSGKRLPSSYQYAAKTADVPFFTVDDLRSGCAVSGDWTGKSWHTHLGFDDIPILSPYECGQRLLALSRNYDFSFFPHWITDIVGHRGTLDDAVVLLETFDSVLAGILDSWDQSKDCIIVTSDHGNIEEVGNRKHTTNLVPTVIIGHNAIWQNRSDTSLTDYAEFVISLLT